MAKENHNVQFDIPNSPPLALRTENEAEYNVYDTITSTNSSTTSDRKRSSISWIDFDIKKSNSSNELKSKIHSCMKKDRQQMSLKEMFFSTFPLFDILRNYSLKSDFLIDVTAGITLSILHIPQAIAYSFLIGIGPIYGLYSSFFPVLVYAFMGTAQHNSIGTIAVVDIMLAEIVKRFKFPAFDAVSINATAISEFEVIGKAGDDPLSTHMPHDAVELMSTICLLTGLLQLGMGFLKMGAISLIFSDQLVSGFSCAAAFHVIVSQLPSVFDVKVDTGSNGPFHLIMEVIAIFQRISKFNYASVTISAIIVVTTFLFKSLLEPQIKKYCNKIPVPIDLIIFVVVTLISKYCLLFEEYGVSIMGDVPTGLPMPNMPRISFANTIILDAISIAVITYAFALSLGKIYAKKHKYTIKPNQEFIALGAANTISSFFGCFVTTASLARTSTMGEHAKSQVSSIVSCGIILTVLLYFAPALYYLPKCAIAIVICCAQKPLVMQVLDFRKSWQLSRYEGLIWLVTFSSVILLGIDFGLFAGVIFSVLTIVLRFYSPKLRILGQLPYTDIYLDVRQHSATREIFGIKILQFSSPLFFMNKDMFQESVYKKILRPQKFKGYPASAKVEALVLDCSSMSFVDSSGVETLAEISNDMHHKGIEVVIAACPPAVISMLARSEFFIKSPNIVIYPSVHEAVNRVATPTLAKKIAEIIP